MTELEQEFDKIQGTKAQPTRYLRSQQEKQAAVAQAIAENEDNEDGEHLAIFNTDYNCNVFFSSFR
jgi:cytoskeleton-associated protein 5